MIHYDDVLARYKSNPTRDNLDWLISSAKQWFGSNWNYKVQQDTRSM